eukprot:7831488-Pyramimonas_sp.AAC.1
MSPMSPLQLAGRAQSVTIMSPLRHVLRLRGAPPHLGPECYDNVTNATCVTGGESPVCYDSVTLQSSPAE